MQESLKNINQIVSEVLETEKPQSVLEISGYGMCLAKLMLECTKNLDRVDLTDGLTSEEKLNYKKVFSSDYFNTINKSKKYDVIIVCHLFENIDTYDAKLILTNLLRKTNICVLVITPMYPYDLSSGTELSTVRAYHPVFFLGLEFSYKKYDDLQAYVFFPKLNYERLDCDTLTSINSIDNILNIKKMKIAYIIHSHGMSGGLKALLQQIKELNDIGHTVNLYYRSDTSKRAIPPWSHLTDDDVSGQIIIPCNANYTEYLSDEDIIVLGFVNLIEEFFDSVIPVVLWEQGSEAFFGDHGKLIGFRSEKRMTMHMFYRSNVYLLAVSQIIETILEGVYNRGSQLFPNGIDTDFYHPNDNKNNEVPVILLVGNPYLSFKCFDFAIAVLIDACKFEIPFKVWWASQSPLKLDDLPFECELFICPTQEQLAELYRNADVFLSASLYESFSLPPLEAMASGTAVIATDSGGINTYAVPGENCLLCEQGDLISMSYALGTLLKDPTTRETLAKAGRETAKQYSFKNITPILEQCLYRIIAKSEGKCDC